MIVNLEFSRIFNNSLVRAKFENHEYGNNVFFSIEDGGYPCQNYLMTPLLNMRTQAEENVQVNKQLNQYLYVLKKTIYKCSG